MARERVIVVDDDPGTVKVLEALLKTEGYVVHAFTTGAAAMEKAKSILPDIVITDLEMPGVSGNQLAAYVRAQDLLKGAYIIFLTSHGAKGDKMKALLSGADDFVVKPARDGEILGRMEVGLRVRRLEKEVREARRKAGRPDAATVAALEDALARVREQVVAAESAVDRGDARAAKGAFRESMAAIDQARGVLGDG